MFYVLKSQKDNELYIGFTSDLKKRFELYSKGLVPATKTRKPLVLIFYEAFSSRKDALKDESFFKTGYGREVLKDKISDSIG